MLVTKICGSVEIHGVLPSSLIEKQRAEENYENVKNYTAYFIRLRSRKIQLNNAKHWTEIVQQYSPNIIIVNHS